MAWSIIYSPALNAPGIVVSNFVILRTLVSYSTLQAADNAAQAGDTILVEPKTYSGATHLATINTANLSILSAVANSKFTIRVDTTLFSHGIVTLASTVGTFLMQDYTLDGIAPDGSISSGIWTSGGAYNITLKRYRHMNCNNGMITEAVPTAGAVLNLQYGELVSCGNGSGSQHNAYIGGIDQLNVIGLYSHICNDGHLLKCRAKQATIQWSRLTDETGNASYEIEFPCAGNVLLEGVILEQGAGTDNSTILSYGAELGIPANCPADGRTNSIVMRQCTIVNHRGAGGTFFAISGSPGTNTRIDNVYSGTGAPTETGNSTIALSAFIDEANYDFRLTSPIAGSQNWATQMYQHATPPTAPSSIARSDANRGALG